MDPMNPPLEKAGEVAEEMKEEVGKYVESAKEYWDQMTDTVKEKTHIAREGINKAKSYADDYVHAYPWKAIGIAAAVGALAAFFLQSCSRNCHDEECKKHNR